MRPVQVWDLVTHQLLRHLAGHTDSVRSLCTVGDNQVGQPRTMSLLLSFLPRFATQPRRTALPGLCVVPAPALHLITLVDLRRVPSDRWSVAPRPTMELLLCGGYSFVYEVKITIDITMFVRRVRKTAPLGGHVYGIVAVVTHTFASGRATTTCTMPTKLFGRRYHICLLCDLRSDVRLWHVAHDYDRPRSGLKRRNLIQLSCMPRFQTASAVRLRSRVFLRVGRPVPAA